MSNVRHSYWAGSGFLGGPKEQQFISEDRQTAVVRVYGAKTPEQEARIRTELHGQITQFWEACNTQHMLSQSSHSFYTRVVPGAELVYINSAGQPQIIVRPEELAAEEDRLQELRTIVISCHPRWRSVVRYVDAPWRIGDWNNALRYGYVTETNTRIQVLPDYAVLSGAVTGTDSRPNSIPISQVRAVQRRINIINDFYQNIMPTLPFQTTELYKIFAGTLRHSYELRSVVTFYWAHYMVLVWKEVHLTYTQREWDAIGGDPTSIGFLANHKATYQTAWDFGYNRPFWGGATRLIYNGFTWHDEPLPPMQVTAELVPCTDPPRFFRPDGTQIFLAPPLRSEEEASGESNDIRRGMMLGDEGYWLQRL